MNDDLTVHSFETHVGMDYPGKVISKNHMWAGGVRGRLKPEAGRWKRRLAESVEMALKEFGPFRYNLVQPVKIEVAARYWDKRTATDPHNLLELIADAVEEATGLNDRDFQVSTRETVYGVLPAIVIYLTVLSTGPEVPTDARPDNGSNTRTG